MASSLDGARTLGSYQLLSQLAVGGMAEIYVARTHGVGGFEKMVALKVIHPNFSADPDFVQMLVDEAKLSVQEFLNGRHPAWNLVGRVHFNLAENRRDEEAPFAFLATYTTRLSAEAKAQHLPLGRALQEYAGARNRERLLSLLLPVQRAAEHCPWLKTLVATGEIFHPLRWSPEEAFQLLKDLPASWNSCEIWC